MVNTTEILLIHSENAISGLFSHIIGYYIDAIVIEENLVDNCEFLPIFGSKIGHYGGHFEYRGQVSNLTSEMNSLTQKTFDRLL